MQAPLQARNDSDAAQTDTAKTVAQKRVLADNLPEAVAQRKLAEMMNNSPRVLQQRALSDAIHNSPRMVAQRHQMNALFGGAVKPQGDSTMPSEASPAQREGKINKTGLPNQLKSGIESLSGMSMDHVKVHYNSAKPAQLQAHAYAQGNEIHLGAGQERHLPHEAWHVVQQAQGRVKPTLQMKGGVRVNDDVGLEGEADLMGEKALAMNAVQMWEQQDVGTLETTQSSADLNAKQYADHHVKKSYPETVQRVQNIDSKFLQGKFFIKLEDDPVIEESREAFELNYPDRDVHKSIELDSSQIALSAANKYFWQRDKRRLANIPAYEELIISAHGTVVSNVEVQPAVKYGGLTAKQAAQKLSENGLSKKYKGKIFLLGCNTGVIDDKSKHSFASSLQKELSSNYSINCSVQGTLAPSFLGFGSKEKVQHSDRTSQSMLEFGNAVKQRMHDFSRKFSSLRKNIENGDSELDILYNDIFNWDMLEIEMSSLVKNLWNTLSAADGNNTIILHRTSKKRDAPKGITKNKVDSAALDNDIKKAAIDWAKDVATVCNILKARREKYSSENKLKQKNDKIRPAKGLGEKIRAGIGIERGFSRAQEVLNSRYDEIDNLLEEAEIYLKESIKTMNHSSCGSRDETQ